VTLTVAHITPLISLLAGVLILIVPALLNYIVAIYLIVAGAIGLNEIHHFLTDLKHQHLLKHYGDPTRPARRGTISGKRKRSWLMAKR
jgi:hypothetical protein